MHISKKLGYFTASIDKNGFLALSSPSSMTIELPPQEVVQLLKLLASDRKRLKKKARKAQQEQQRGQ